MGTVYQFRLTVKGTVVFPVTVQRYREAINLWDPLIYHMYTCIYYVNIGV